ncbi:carbamoyltransferase [Acidobacteria bacterium AH-259-D05]|nr:carbamoyltransferase [Acidobacteria bacterium AH-259-D05]
MTRILGISAFYHDSAACLIEEGRILAALQEERFSREKHDSSFPSKAIAAALKIGHCTVSDLDYVVFYEKPFVKLERLLETYLRHCPRGFSSYLKAIPLWIKEKIWIKEWIKNELQYEGEILFADHHESHAASAYYPSPFDSAALLTIDAVGEWTTTALGQARGNEIHLDSEIRFPHSLGLLYTAFTYYLGFEVNSGEYKVMGLAPYGNPTYTDLIQNHLIQIHEDGSFRLNTEFFDFETGLKMTSRRFEELFQGPPRKQHEPLSQKHKDLAASIQKVTERVILRTCRYLHQRTGEKYLCMAGGVALNCVANGRLLRETDFEDVWIQPAAGDAGGALGAALSVWHRFLGKVRVSASQSSGRDQQQGSLLGTSYNDARIRQVLDTQRARYSRLDEASLLEKVAGALDRGGLVGWFQGPMEFGPRALGNRSILADPRRREAHALINSRVKFRESFRPFAPAIMEEQVAEYFELDRPSPYMLLVASVRPGKRSLIPAVTHVDGSARIQTVNPTDNPRFHRLLEEFRRQTDCSLLLNTSFNVRGEPIVESPRQAYQCFMRTGLDFLVLENFFLAKEDQPTGLNG